MAFFQAIHPATGGVLLVLLAFASPARAAFPGANGLLAVQPVHGKGVIVVAADGSGFRRVCADGVCRRTRGAAWSLDGRELVYVAGSGALDVIYPDGSCLDCGFSGSAGNAGFTPSGDVLVLPTLGGRHSAFAVYTVGIDGLGERRVIRGAVSGAVWSAQGRLAFVRGVHGQDEVFVADVKGRHIRQLTRTGADTPSWSPDGRFLAVTHAGSVEIMNLQGWVVRALAPGGSPAFSPDGQRVAYIAPHDGVMVIPARGGQPRSVGAVRGQHVDWQPIPKQPPAVCAVPHGSATEASLPEVVVTSRSESSSNPGGSATTTAYLACLPRLNRERLLARDSSMGDFSSPVFSDRTRGGWFASGDYVRSSYSVNQSYHGVGSSYGGSNVTNVLSGCSFDAAPYASDYPGGGSSVSAFLVSPQGYVAWELETASASESIYARDAAGTHQLDSEAPSGSSTGLGNLSITGDQVTWTHGGHKMSATLGKPAC